MTEAVRVDAGAPGSWDAAAVDRGARVLAEGEILAHPTGTVYGLGAGPARLDEEIRRLKGRGGETPLLRLGPDVETVLRSHPRLEWGERAGRLAEAFWPGPLTLVLPDGTPSGLGVRVEGHPLTRRVLDAHGRTMSSTSLNRTGRPPARTPGEVEKALSEMPAAGVAVTWLHAGELPGGPPSTVISLRDAGPRLLRAGAVDPDAIERCLGEEMSRG